MNAATRPSGLLLLALTLCLTPAPSARADDPAGPADPAAVEEDTAPTTRAERRGARRSRPPLRDEGNLGTVDGARIYAQLCQGCHMADGRGARGGGTYPSFADNPNIASAPFVAAIVLHGRRNMPAFAPEHSPAPFFEPAILTDAQVAAVVNHVRTHFGNAYADPITAADVAALHPPQERD